MPSSNEPDAVSLTVFETDRLRCRRWIAADVEPLFEVYSDPEAMRWVGDGTPLTRDGCVTWLEVTERNYRVRGYGMFALVERASDRVVGFIGLVHPGGQPEPEIKYAFRRSHWGRGLASEAVPRLLAHGADAHGLRRIVATVAPENRASQRVLAKAGLALAERRTDDDGSVTLVYAWHAPAAARGCG